MTKLECKEWQRKNNMKNLPLDQSPKQEKSTKPKMKYFNKRVYVYKGGQISLEKDDNLGPLIEVYDSIKEYHRGTELKKLECSGEIHELRHHVQLLIQEGFLYRGKRISPIYYVADYVYTDKNGNTVVEDVKGYDKKRKRFRTTPDFNLKWKLLKYRYPEYFFTMHQ